MKIPKSESAVFEYNHRIKKIEGIIKIALISIIGILAIVHFFGLTKGTILDIIMQNIASQFAGNSPLSVFIICVVGGLFILTVPIELLLINAYSKLPTQSHTLFLISLLGLFIAYTINYFVGYYFSKFATKLISPKQFYSVKIKLNKYGKGVIFLFNVLPLPSQLLTFVCGVFRYNKIRYFAIWLFAWVLKLFIIILFRPQIITLINILKNNI